jgi:hypothetical protein
MAKRLVICTDSGKGPVNGANAFDRTNITKHLEAKGWQVWHWFEDVWLVVTDVDDVGLSLLRDELRNVIGGPNKHVLIMQVDGPVAYSGFGNPNGWPWMATNWGQAK